MMFRLEFWVLFLRTVQRRTSADRTTGIVHNARFNCDAMLRDVLANRHRQWRSIQYSHMVLTNHFAHLFDIEFPQFRSLLHFSFYAMDSTPCNAARAANAVDNRSRWNFYNNFSVSFSVVKIKEVFLDHALLIGPDGFTIHPCFHFIMLSRSFDYNSWLLFSTVIHNRGFRFRTLCNIIRCSSIITYLKMCGYEGRFPRYFSD